MEPHHRTHYHKRRRRRTSTRRPNIFKRVARAISLLGFLRRNRTPIRRRRSANSGRSTPSSIRVPGRRHRDRSASSDSPSDPGIYSGTSSSLSLRPIHQRHPGTRYSGPSLSFSTPSTHPRHPRTVSRRRPLSGTSSRQSRRRYAEDTSTLQVAMEILQEVVRTLQHDRSETSGRNHERDIGILDSLSDAMLMLDASLGIDPMPESSMNAIPAWNDIEAFSVPPRQEPSPQQTRPAIAPVEPLEDCTICYELISDLCTLNPCHHKFDYPCIMKWFESVYSESLDETLLKCPLCRQLVESLSHRNGTEGAEDNTRFPDHFLEQFDNNGQWRAEWQTVVPTPATLPHYRPTSPAGLGRSLGVDAYPHAFINDRGEWDFIFGGQ